MIIGSASGQNEALTNRQILGICVGFIVMFVVSCIRYEYLLKLSVIIYIGCIGILVAVLYFGVTPVGAGAKRWIDLPAIGRIQPSEFVKIGLILFFSWFIAKYKDMLNKPLMLFALLILTGLPAVLILKEPDLSTTIVLLVMVLCMIYTGGLNYKWLLGGIASLAVLIGILLYLIQIDRVDLIPFLRGYQANRILAWIAPDKYVDANMQQVNSIMAIGSGQLLGKGLDSNTVESVKFGNFLSEEQTDFIFAVVGEELGFVGSVAIILLFALVVFQCYYMAARAKDLQGRLIGAGVASLIAFQSFTNIAVTTGLFPNTGLPLPFISYGLSSLLSMFVGIGLVLNVGLQRTGRSG